MSLHFLRLAVLLPFLVLGLSPGSVEAQTVKADSPTQLRGAPVSVIGEVGGPAGGYTLGVEHLFVRTSAFQLGMYVGGSYGRRLIWDGTSRAVTAGIVSTHQIGSIGAQPLALEGGLGATRIHSEFDSGNTNWTTSYRPYVTGALRVESEEGRFAYRVGVVAFSGEHDPVFLLPVLGLRVGL